MKVLSFSDVIVPTLYSPAVRQHCPQADLLLACGDLPYYYIEFLVSMLDKPTFFVRGNHDHVMEYSDIGRRSEPHGAVNLHRRVIMYQGVLLAGVEGSPRYRPGPFQYSPGEMWGHVFSLLPKMFSYRMTQGRFLDVFVTHAPSRGIHDMDDLPHRGVKAFRWLVDVFQPAYHFHGHIHIYRPDTVALTQQGKTQVINTFGYRETLLKLPHGGRHGSKG